MKTIPVTEFKAHCLELLNQVAKTGEPMILTKRGKPTAMVSLPPAEIKPIWRLGLFEDSCKIVGDVIAPFDEPWHVEPFCAAVG